MTFDEQYSFLVEHLINFVFQSNTVFYFQTVGEF